MKKFLLLLVALFATTALVKAESIAYPENPYGWQNKEDMFQAFMTDAGKSTGGLTIADFQAMAGTVSRWAS